MDVTPHDRALIAAALAQVAEQGWRRLDLAEAARAAGVPLAEARQRVPDRCALLLRFGVLADSHALAGAAAEGPVRDRLFDLLMRRIDALNEHRAGVLALLRALPFDPAAGLLVTAASLRSMGWMLAAAGAGATGPLGALRAKALLGVWLWTVRAWERDSSEDLAATMAALDQALARAEQAESWLRRTSPAASPAASPPGPPQADPPAPPAPPTSEGADHAQ